MVQPVYKGVSSLVTSGHLPPAPLNQTNTNPEMPESDNTNYTLQLLRSLPGAWEASTTPRCLRGGLRTSCKGSLLQLFPNPFLSLSALLFFFCTMILFPIPPCSGQRLFSHCCVGIIFQTPAYGESLFLLRDVNHDSMTRACVFMAA